MELPPLEVIVDSIRVTVEPFPQVKVVYIFGSVAAGRAGPLSDVDVAILLDPSADPEREVLGRIQDDLCRVLRTDRIDLVCLNGAPPHLAYRVVRDGRRILSADEMVRQAFESSTVMRYLDFRPLREQALRHRQSPVGRKFAW
jgi:predicted nucleotidyltransferase